MAINYLNNVDFNRNELQNAQLIKSQVENQPNDAAVGGTPVEGQLYFNTTSDVLKIYGNGSWSEVGGGVETLTTTDGTYIDLTPNSATAGNVTVTADISAVDGSSGASERYLTKSNVWAEISTIPGTYEWTFDGDSGTTQPVDSGDTVTFTGSTKITTTALAGDELTIEHDLQSQTNSTSAASPAAGATFTVIDSVTVDTTGHIGGKNLKTITLPADTNTTSLGIADINGAEQFKVTDTVDLRFAAAGGASVAFDSTNKVVTYSAPSNTNETYTLPVAAGTVNTAVLNLTAGGSGSGIKSVVTIAGTTDQVAISETAGNNGVVTVGLPDDVIITDTLTVSGDLTVTSDAFFNGTAFDINANTAIDFGTNKITNVVDPTNPQDAATKQYVDDATVGGLIYQGSYDATLNTPDLDSASSIAVEKGWTYTVTVAGLFFTEQVRIGDVLIAEVDQAAGASTLANWTTVQNNIDLASDAQVGIGNVKKSTVATLDGISVAYSSGTASVGLDIQGLTYITQALTSSDLAGIEIPIYNGDIATAANQKIEVQDLIPILNPTISKTGSIAVSQTSGTVAHGFGINTLVQTFDAGTGATVFCDVVRDTNTPYDVTATISTAQATAITILVQKIG